MMLHVSLGIVHLVVGSRDGDDDRFNVEEFLLGEGGRSAACEADVGHLVQLPHFSLTEEVETMHILLCEKWLEIVV